MNISGGSYFEHCSEPLRSEFYGSGLRAAAALSGLSPNVVLHTYIAEENKDLLTAISATFGFDIRTEQVPTNITFRYDHGLADPIIHPPPEVVRAESPLVVESNVVLRYGMLEGDAQVRGDRVVYDPQSPFAPERFDRNGSMADELAIVVNMSEGRALTGQRAPAEVVRQLLEAHNASVAIVKMGSRGAAVGKKGESPTIVSPYRTGKVWPIGSGDVFAAVFAYWWAEKSADPVDAARQASLSTAYYCSEVTLPIPTALSAADFGAIPFVTEKSPPSKVYLAGPFFTMSQRWLINEARRSLAHQDLEVFSPFHDVGHGVAHKVVPEDIAALNACDVMFALVDGLDSGTLFEIGYARAKGKKVIAFVQSESEEAIKMLEGTDCILVDDFVSGIYTTSWEARS